MGNSADSRENDIFKKKGFPSILDFGSFHIYFINSSYKFTSDFR